MEIPKIRNMKEAYAEIKVADPGSVITYGRFRRDVARGKIPSKKWGRTYLIDLVDVEQYAKNFDAEDTEQASCGDIRRIAE